MKRLVVVTLAVLAVLAPATAYAGVGQPLPPFNEAPCMEQMSLSEAEWDTGGKLFVLNGAAVQCAPVVADGGFRIASYEPGESTGSAPSWNQRKFFTAEVGAVRTFGAAAVAKTAGDHGVCILGANLERLVCGIATVTVRTNGASALLSPLPTDDPLVDKPVTVGPYTGGVKPPGHSGLTGNCGTCF